MNSFELETNDNGIRLEGFYRSEVQGHIRFEEGERKEEEFYLYYKFFPEGIWICKTTGDLDFDFEDFFRIVDMDQIMYTPDHDEPMDENRELFYQCGKYVSGPGFVKLTWKNSHIEGKERAWKFYMQGPDRLETEFGTFGLDYLEY